ncbi:MAG: hypothetical protein GF349_04410 [Candidatus Magasanikbacteria bacterium]|nr:hypothetical protein [Candidatus Magasanikbacteria bacterium]
MRPKALYLSLTIAGLFFIIDQYFKYLARTYRDFTYYIIDPWLGWELFLNKGIAFSIPFPNIIILILTPLILGFIIFFLLSKKQKKESLVPSFSLFLIIFGALSNYLDRIFFAATVDYFRIFSSVINIADIMITTGAFLFIYNQLKNK